MENTTQYCMVTHPKQPNKSGHARGRSIHIVKEGTKLSLCNMLVDTIAKNEHEIWIALNRKHCKICFKPLTPRR